MTHPRGLLDMSVFIAIESGRPLAVLPAEVGVSVVTLGELHAGVLAAISPESRGQRLKTLAFAEANFEAMPIDERIAREWGRLVVDARSRNRRAPINDSWIAATATVYGLIVVTQDGDYDGLDVAVLRV